MALEPLPGHSANIGAAMCVVLRSDEQRLDLAVPLVPGEALWVGLLVPFGTKIKSARSGDRPLRFERRGGASLEKFFRSAPFGMDEGGRTAEVVVRSSKGEAIMHLELSSLEAFNDRFGAKWSPDPPPSTFGRWRLP